MPPSARSVPTDRSFGLDAVRALAVLLVFVAHGGFVFIEHTGPLKATFVMGYLGVEIFFALSGFLLGGALLDSTASAPQVLRFWQRRWARTLPLYYLFLGLNYLIIREHGAQPTDVPVFAAFLQNLVTPHPGWFQESWSLSIEELFYLAAPLVFWGAHACRIPPGRAIAGWLAAALALHFGFVWITDPASWDEGIRKIGVARADAIAWGVAAAWWVRHRTPTPPQQRLMFGAGLVAIAVAGWAYVTLDLDRSTFARFFMLPLGTLGAAAVLPWAATWGDAHPHRPMHRSLRATARWAYPLYLIQLPVLRLMIWTCDWAAQGPLEVAAQTLLYLVLSFGGAAFLHAFVERPVLMWRDTVWPHRRAPPPLPDPASTGRLPQATMG